MLNIVIFSGALICGVQARLIGFVCWTDYNPLDIAAITCEFHFMCLDFPSL